MAFDVKKLADDFLARLYEELYPRASTKRKLSCQASVPEKVFCFAITLHNDKAALVAKRRTVTPMPASEGLPFLLDSHELTQKIERQKNLAALLQVWQQHQGNFDRFNLNSMLKNLTYYTDEIDERAIPVIQQILRETRCQLGSFSGLQLALCASSLHNLKIQLGEFLWAIESQLTDEGYQKLKSCHFQTLSYIGNIYMTNGVGAPEFLMAIATLMEEKFSAENEPITKSHAIKVAVFLVFTGKADSDLLQPLLSIISTSCQKAQKAQKPWLHPIEAQQLIFLSASLEEKSKRYSLSPHVAFEVELLKRSLV